MKKILIVENDVFIADSMQDILESNGYYVTAKCRTGIEAIGSINEEMPDIVLMDVSLDGPIDGISTAKAIRKNHVIPIIYITQHTDAYVFSSAKETFPSNFLSKPYNEQEVLRAIDIALNTAIATLKNDSIYSKIENGVFIYTKDGIYEKLLFDEILYIMSAGSSSHIYYKRGANGNKKYYTVSISSNHVVKKINYAKLHKVSRSVYVNIDKINKVTTSHVYIDNTPMKISDDFKGEILNDLLVRIKR